MSSNLSAAEAAPAAAPLAHQSAGACLRAARTAQGLHIAALAAQLKVPQAKLEALEADRYQDLPDMTFARALAKAMCRVLKVDAEAVLLLLPRGEAGGLDRVSRGLNQPFRERHGREDVVSLEWLKRPVVWALAGLLLAALLVYTVPASWLDSVSSAPAADQVESPPVVAPPTEPAASAAPLPAALPASVPAAAVEAVVPAPAVTAPVVPAVAPVRVPLQADQVPLRVRASEESWVEIADASGQVLLSKLMRPGEIADLAVKPPLRLRIGNVAGTELILRGVPVDLTAQSNNNVARLELN